MVMMKMSEWTYKSKKIEMDKEGKFFCKELGIEDKPSPDSVRKDIDKTEKQKFKRIRAYYYYTYGNKGKPSEVEITSMKKTPYDSLEFFTKDDTGNIRKESTLYKIDDHNKKLFKEISDLNEKKEALEKQAEGLLKKLHEIGEADVKAD